jgi:ubiquinone/menaquinone biosynthesis C-methylase UbiE
MFPHARFAVGNALCVDAPDQAFDYVLVQDLFEHLSLPALDRALTEVCRIARSGLCLGLFNADEADVHRVQPLDQYHWNRLSVPRLRELLDRHGFSTEVVHIDTFVRWHFNCPVTHNPTAYTLLAERRRSRGPEGTHLEESPDAGLSR